jgi:peptide/nickel transport system substrate-binding protein
MKMTFRNLMAASLLAAAAWGGPLAAQDGDTLVVAVPSDPANLEPGSNRAEPIGSEIILNVFDTLVAWTPPDFAELEGRLAESWTISEDGRTFTFQLRDGVTFHDGTPFDAEAVKFSLERTLEMNSYVQATFGLIEDISVTSPGEVAITLSEPYPAFLSILAQPQAAIVSPTAVAEKGDAFAVEPVGTGPFVFESYQPDTSVTLTANPDYFRGAPEIERLIFRIIPDASTRRLELEAGGVDIVQQQGQLQAIAAADIAALSGNPDIEILEAPSQIIRQFEFNNSLTEGPLADVDVRRALTYAIDYEGLLEGIFGGTAVRVYGPLTSNSWAYNPRMEEIAPSYDPERARELLAEAGVDPADLDLTLYSFQGQLWGALSTFVQANLADIGIDVTIAQTEFPSYRALHTAGEHQVAMDGRQPWYNDPDAHITIGYLSSLKDTAMTFRMPEDPELDGLILEAQQTPDFDERRALYFEIQEKIMEKVPGAYLFSPKLIVFQRANIDGLVINGAPPLNEYWSVTKN